MHLTLDKAIELALSENPTMKVAEKEIELKEVSKTEAWQNLLPTVSLNGTVTYNIKVAEIKTSMGSFKMGMDDSNTWNGALQVSLPLYAPAVYKTMSLTKSDLELAVEKGRGSKIDLVSRSPPTGIPYARRVTFIPIGLSSPDKYSAVASPSTVGFVAIITSATPP